MTIFTSYIFLAILVFGINVIPGFMPPTWMILAFFRIHYHLNMFIIVAIGAGCATLGRIVLAQLAQLYFRPFLSEKSQVNVDVLGNFFNKHTKISIPLLILYAFFPIPSNHVYIAAGLARINIKILAVSFFLGRLISYTFWVGASHKLADSLEGVFQTQYTNMGGLLIELVSFSILFVFIKINWVNVTSWIEGKLVKIKK